MNKYIYIHCKNIGETNKEQDSTTEYLKIDGKSIQILDEYIAQSIISEHSDHKKWKLCYFANTEYSVQFYVYLYSYPRDYSLKRYSNELSKGMIVDDIKTTDLNNSLFESISKNIRGSKSLTLENYVDHTSGKYCIDGSGIVWVSEIKDDPNAQRFIYVYLLARAYEIAMQRLIQEFAEIQVNYKDISEEDVLKLKHAYYKVCKFNILHFTNFPVKSQHNLFKKIWDDLSKHFKLAEINHEISKQALEFKNIIEFEAIEQRNKLEKLQFEQTNKIEKDKNSKIQRYFIILAIIPIIISIIELTFF